MGASGFASLSPRPGPLHRVSPAGKLLVALSLVVAAPFVPWIVAGFLAVAIAVGRVPLWFLLRRFLAALPVILSVSLLVLFREDGARLFARLVTRSSLSVLALILVGSTTTMTGILAALRQAHVPALLVTTLALAHRYLHVLDDESRRMRRARASRTWSRPRRREVWRNLSSVAAGLFVRASERAERIYAAMCARGWRT